MVCATSETEATKSYWEGDLSQGLGRDGTDHIAFSRARMTASSAFPQH